MSSYRIKHFFLIIALILATGFALLWLFNEYFPHPYPNEEFYLLLLIYLIVLAITSRVFNDKGFVSTHRQMGFHKISINAVFIALAIGIVLWFADYFYQTQLMQIEIKNEALDWSKNQSNYQATFLTMVVLAPIVEELLFRGIFLKIINQYLSKFWTAVLVSLLFTAVHASWLMAPSLFIAALLYAWLVFKFNSIIPSIIAHIVNNCLTFAFYFLLLGNF
jgi:membrane protease YdiL (CAAX protease family)